eukprot:gb/GEZN01025946.1/.p1 GENE.gb/GEZN01025946.1/~~gb/GEZN01025946.1/.p1  ORF type:complete len:115 (+),score=27.08 gb/GEZN01025946.1/:29-373(+)
MTKCTSYGCHADVVQGTNTCEKHKSQDTGKKGSATLIRRKSKEKAGVYDQESRKKAEDEKTKQESMARALKEKGGIVVAEDDADEWSDEDEDPHAKGKKTAHLREDLLGTPKQK